MSEKTPALNDANLKAVLQKTTLFKGLSGDEIQSCLDCSKAESVIYDKGEMVFSEGDTPSALPVLISGSVTLGLDYYDGQRNILTVYSNPGDIFGHELILTGESMNRMFAQAQTRSQILMIPKAFMMGTCERNCGFHSSLITNLMQMMAREALSEEMVEQIRSTIHRHMDEVEQVARAAAHVVSSLTHYTALVMAPQLRRTTLRRIQLVYLYEGAALVVIVTNAGVVKDSVIPVPAGLDENDLALISRMLTERFAGHSLTDINVSLLPALSQRFGTQRAFLNSIIAALEDSVVQPSLGNLVMDGAVNMFDYPEYQDINKASMFLSAMQSHDTLYRMLAKRTKRDYTITIGSENADPALKDCSVVTTTYELANGLKGKIGIVGPKRMDYEKVVGTLQTVMAQLNVIGRGQEVAAEENIQERE